LRGGKIKATPPLWVLVLQLANKFGIPPWQFEKECSAEWWHRIMLDIELRADQENDESA
jgi:hypothetical protein